MVELQDHQEHSQNTSSVTLLKRGSELTQYCTPGRNASNTDCLETTSAVISPVTAAFIMFVASEILGGISGAPILALGIPYLDNALSRKSASKMIGGPSTDIKHH